MKKMSNSKYLKTKFDALESIAVLCTEKTLNERFTLNSPRTVFVLRNGFTAPYKDVKVTGKVAFENGRVLNCDRRFSLYQRGDINLTEKGVLSPEDKNRLSIDLEDIRSKRRKVLRPGKSNDETSAECCSKEFNIRTQNNVSSAVTSTACSTLNKSTLSSSNEELKTEEFGGKAKIKNTTSCGRAPIKRTWSGRVKNVDLSYVGKISKYTQRSRFLTPSPHQTKIKVVYRNPNFFSSVYKWQKVSRTKEELDEELERYMCEARIKVTPTPPVAEDVDAFVCENMSETEKITNESKNTDIK